MPECVTSYSDKGAPDENRTHPPTSGGAISTATGLGSQFWGWLTSLRHYAPPATEFSLLDGKLDEMSGADICKTTATLRPDLIGITCMTVEYPQAVNLAQRLKKQSDASIVIGGAHVNAVGTQALAECAEFDFACIGEGEHLVVELANALKLWPGASWHPRARVAQRLWVRHGQSLTPLSEFIR